MRALRLPVSPLLLSLSLSVVACGGGDGEEPFPDGAPPPGDGGVDVAADALEPPGDAAGDAGEDAGRGDAGADGGADAGDGGAAGTDAGSVADAGEDAGDVVDAGAVTDAGVGMDAGAATDAGSGVDAGVGMDAGVAMDAGEDAGVAMDAGEDAGTVVDAGAPLALYVEAATSTPFFTIFYGTTGGTEAVNTCPSGQVVVGFNGHADDTVVRSLGLECGTPTLASDGASGTRVVVGTGVSQLPHGEATGTVFAFRCPDDGVLAGIRGLESDALIQLTVDCAPLVVSGLPDAPVARLGAVAASSPTWGGTTGFDYSWLAPADRVAVGAMFSSSTRVDGVRLNLATVNLR